MEGFYVGILAVLVAILVTSCNNAKNVALDCATKGKYASTLAEVSVDCSVIKESK